jgi:hypothetical protein
MMPELSATFSKTRELPQSFFISLRAFCSAFSDNRAQRFSLVTGVSRFFPSSNFTASPGVAVVGATSTKGAGISPVQKGMDK